MSSSPSNDSQSEQDGNAAGFFDTVVGVDQKRVGADFSGAGVGVIFSSPQRRKDGGMVGGSRRNNTNHHHHRRGGGGKTRSPAPSGFSVHNSNPTSRKKKQHSNLGGNNTTGRCGSPWNQQQNRRSKSPQYHGKERSKSPQYHNNMNRSNSPNRSKSPKGVGGRQHQQHQHQQHQHQQNRRSRSPRRNNKAPADMTVICRRVDLWDNFRFGEGDEHTPPEYHPTQNLQVAPYHFAPDVDAWIGPDASSSNHQHAHAMTVSVLRASHYTTQRANNDTEHNPLDCVDTSIPNPLEKELDKYWAQRRRLFARFDMGIQLDKEGWYSATPEVIADHVAQRAALLSESSAFNNRRQTDNAIGTTDDAPRTLPPGIVVLDAFCGCGGNSIAFGKIPSQQICRVVCVDLDRSKLRKAAHNACLYEIPRDKLVFVECNALFVLEHCYRDGQLRLDSLRKEGHTPTTHEGATHKISIELPSRVETEECAGFLIGGLGLLPPRIDAVFIDPPWGGVEYNVLGKNAYCLEKNMRIQIMPSQRPKDPGLDGFFDTFGPGPGPGPGPSPPSETDPTHFVNGVDLLKMAASATKSRLVIYDLPKNINKISLGNAAMAAGYRGNLKLEEHYLNGRLKTVTAYLGTDYSSILMET